MQLSNFINRQSDDPVIHVPNKIDETKLPAVSSNKLQRRFVTPSLDVGSFVRKDNDGEPVVKVNKSDIWVGEVASEESKDGSIDQQ